MALRSTATRGYVINNRQAVNRFKVAAEASSLYSGSEERETDSGRPDLADV